MASTQANRTSNEINVIAPYKHAGMWVFDDPRVGLSQEPFVAGADDIIDAMTRNLPNAAAGFTLIFSAIQFPGHEYRFTHVGPQGSGNVYRSPELAMEGWLCPALLRYFDNPPQELYVQVKAS